MDYSPFNSERWYVHFFLYKQCFSSLHEETKYQRFQRPYLWIKLSVKLACQDQEQNVCIRLISYYRRFILRTSSIVQVIWKRTWSFNVLIEHRILPESTCFIVGSISSCFSFDMIMFTLLYFHELLNDWLLLITSTSSHSSLEVNKWWKYQSFTHVITFLDNQPSS